MRVVVDTGPLLSAANRRDRAHRLAAALVAELGRDLIVPLPVAVEVDQLLRARVGPAAARAFLHALDAGEHRVGYLSPGMFREAVEIDARFADLDLGIADGSVMALADRHDLPILTFDFSDFRAAHPTRRPAWRLIVDEARYRSAVGG